MLTNKEISELERLKLNCVQAALDVKSTLDLQESANLAWLNYLTSLQEKNQSN